MQPDDDQEPRTPGQLPVYRIERKKRWNLNVRLRRRGDLTSMPMISTISLYPDFMTIDERGQPCDPPREGVLAEFGPMAMRQMQELSSKEKDLELELLIPTLDPLLVVPGGVLVQRHYHTYQSPYENPPPNPPWVWDLEPSWELRELVHGRPVPDLMPELPETPVDPLLAVLRRGAT